MKDGKNPKIETYQMERPDVIDSDMPDVFIQKEQGADLSLNARIKLDKIKDEQLKKEKTKEFEENEKEIAGYRTNILVIDSFLKYSPFFIFGLLFYYGLQNPSEWPLVVMNLFFSLALIIIYIKLRVWYEHKLNVLLFKHKKLMKELENIK
ncbi:MAG: hypothetical protein ABIJ74_04000 [archaeon]